MALRATSDSLLETIVNLCKRRGFVFRTSDIYDGLPGCFDYGPLGVEMKRNLANEWWKSTVTMRSDVFGAETRILQHTKAWQSSGHLSNFKDCVSNCSLSGGFFRVDHAMPISDIGDTLTITAPNKDTAKNWKRLIDTKLAPGAQVHLEKTTLMLAVEQKDDKHIYFSGENGPVAVAHRGIVCPQTNSPFVGEERFFSGMMATSQMSTEEAVSALVDVVEKNKDKSREELYALLKEKHLELVTYLRPELAQGSYQQFNNILQSIGSRLPFGIAQIGTSFRNEKSNGPFLFRVREFDQMELHYFCHPEESGRSLQNLLEMRLRWWRKFTHDTSAFSFKDIPQDNLPHYSNASIDVEYDFPFGRCEIESLSNRTDYDLRAHTANCKHKLMFFDGTGKGYFPHCVESSAGLDRAMLAYLCNAYQLREMKVDENKVEVRPFMNIDRRLAPYKVAVLPIVKNKPQLVEIAKRLAAELRAAGLRTAYNEQRSLGVRYTVHDEMGTPFCIPIDDDTLHRGVVKLRARNTMLRESAMLNEVCATMLAYFKDDDVSMMDSDILG